MKHEELYRRLAAWREQFSEFMDVSASSIIQQRTMMNIANELPLNKVSLKAVNGVGRMTLERYGDDILKIVREYVLDMKKSKA